MALISCQECGAQISNLAPACPKCGFPSGATKDSADDLIPEATKTSPKARKLGTVLVRGFVLGVLVLVVLVLVVLVVVGMAVTPGNQPNGSAVHSQPDTKSAINSNNTTSSDDSTIPVFVGNKGEFTSETMACVDKHDLDDFKQNMGKAVAATDNVGEIQAMDDAVNASCKMLSKGTTGLVIDSGGGGFLQMDDRVRLDSDLSAVWIDSGDIGPIPGQPNNP